MSEAVLKKLKLIFLLVSFVHLSMFFALAYALPFKIVPKEGVVFPSKIINGATITAYYTVTNNTIMQRNNNYVKYLPINVTQYTGGSPTYPDTCGLTFNLASNASCTLQLTISGAVDANDPDPHHHLFVCFPGGMTCAGPYANLQLNVLNVNLTSLAITPVTSTLAITPPPPPSTIQYTALGTLSDGTTMDFTSLATWHSSVPNVATIAAGGLATAVNAGTTTITAMYNGTLSNPATLTVTNPVVDVIIAPTSASVEVNQSTTFTAKAKYANGTLADITTGLTWDSNDHLIATIDAGGSASGLAVGTAFITAKYNNVTSSIPAILTVSNPLKSILITLNPDTQPTFMFPGQTRQFKAMGHYASGPDLDITNQVTWSTSGVNANAVTIDSTGKATAVANGRANDIGIQATDTATSTVSNIFNLNVKSMAYITQLPPGANGMFQCPLQQNGTIFPCLFGVIVNGIFANQITLDRDRKHAYFSTANPAQSPLNSIYYCQLDQTSDINAFGQLLSCHDAGGGNTFVTPEQIVIHPTLDVIYVPDSGPANSVKAYHLLGDGSLGPVSSSATFPDPPTGVAVDGVNNKLYVAAAPKVYICDLNSGEIVLNSCIVFTPDAAGAYSLALSKDGFLYMSVKGTGDVIYCNTGGSSTNCGLFNFTYPSPLGLGLNFFQKLLYVVNPQLTRLCPIGSNGGLDGSCLDTLTSGDGATSTVGIAIA